MEMEQINQEIMVNFTNNCLKVILSSLVNNIEGNAVTDTLLDGNTHARVFLNGRGMSSWTVFWTTVSSFFTSLIPENPAPVNIN